ncbi:MAG TPA: sigma-70 family RNA polymerase sigma factor [Planctomycetota bacterium]|nr:sigma-70 family RNA polymerase sigma factor [Planctomycetota bacterium]
MALTFQEFRSRATELARRRLRACGAPDFGPRLAEVLAQTRGADLYLAIACDAGVAGAWECFTARYGSRLRGLARHFGLSTGDAETLARDLPGDLVSPPPSRTARTIIGTYDGSGTLFDWIATIVARRVTDRMRARARAPENLGAEDASRAKGAGAIHDGPDPALLVLDAEVVLQLEEGLREAWEGLTPREELSLLLCFGEGLSQRALVPLFGLSESAVSRTIKGAIEKLKAAVLPRFLAASPEGWRDREGLWHALREAVVKQLQVRATQSDILVGRTSAHES